MNFGSHKLRTLVFYNYQCCLHALTFISEIKSLHILLRASGFCFLESALDKLETNFMFLIVFWVINYICVLFFGFASFVFVGTVSFLCNFVLFILFFHLMFCFTFFIHHFILKLFVFVCVGVFVWIDDFIIIIFSFYPFPHSALFIISYHHLH